MTVTCNDAATTEGRPWYLIYSKPRLEHVARENLARQGFQVYLPMGAVQRRGQSRLEPFFPRYLFIRLDVGATNWAPVRSTRGVMRLVGFGDAPARVPHGLVEELQQREAAGSLHERPPQYRKGDAVRLLDGPLAGYEGIFLARSGSERATLLLCLMGGQAQVRVAIDTLAPAD